MKYPKFLKVSDKIGVTAPSDGIIDRLNLKRLDTAIKNFEEIGYKTIETTNVRKSNKGRSGSSEDQAKELEELYLNDDIKVIFCAAGGDFLIEMLPYLNFQKITEHPKWIQGYSDPTALLYTITTNLDIATIYSHNFKSFGMIPWHKSLTQNLEVLKGNIQSQSSFDYYEAENHELKIGTEGYHLTQKVKWQSLNGEKTIQMNGRIIGSCIDILSELFGTKYDKTRNFVKKYKEDGIIWYFDNCELSQEQLIRTLWKFRENGWFEYCKGIIFGRCATNTSYYNISLEQALHHALDCLKVPIIINADIGHIAPRMTIINGAIAEIILENEKADVNFKLL